MLLLSSVYQILPPKRFTVYRPVVCLSFTSLQRETFIYRPRVSIKMSEAGDSSTIAAAISSTYWLLPPSVDRLGRFAQLFQRLLLFVAVFLLHYLADPSVNHTFCSWGNCSYGGTCCAQGGSRPGGGGTLSLPRPISAVFSCKALCLGSEM